MKAPRERTLNGETWLEKPRPGYREVHLSNMIPGAAFIERDRFEAALQSCLLTATLALEIKGRRQKQRVYPTAGLTPEFFQLAWEVRAAIARACKRELYVIGWEELTPLTGTPGLERK